MNPINRDLKEYRNAIEHYQSILKIDQMIKNNEMEDDGRPCLSHEDILKINNKIKGLSEKRDELLKQEKEYY